MSKLLQIIENYNTSTGGSCGISIVKLSEKAGVGMNDIKSLLKELHTAGKIKVREGINSKLIFPSPLAPKGESPLTPEGGITKTNAK